MAMTSVRGRPRFATWSVPRNRLAIEYDLEILEIIGRKGDAAGLLLGSYDGARVRVLGFETSQKGTDGLAGALLARSQQAPADSRTVVGWYRSHQRNGVELSGEEITIHERLFPEPWQVGLLLAPDPEGRVHPRFFLRESAASAPNQSRVVQNRAVWAVLAAILALCGGTVFFIRSRVLPETPRHLPGILNVEAERRDGNVELTWDKGSAGEARQGRLEVRDGPVVGEFTLDRNALAAGRMPYRQTSDVAQYRLTIERADGTLVQGSTTFVASAPPPKRFEPPPVADRVKEAPRTEPLPVPEPIRTAQMPRVTIPERALAVPGPPPPVSGSASPPGSAAEFDLAGHWLLKKGAHSRSPAVPEFVSITIVDTPGGVQGRMEARYRSHTKTDRVHFSFAGKINGASARFPWPASGGGRGEIEFIRVPNSADTVEVLWRAPDSTQMFDDVLQRVK